MQTISINSTPNLSFSSQLSNALQARRAQRKLHIKFDYILSEEDLKTFEDTISQKAFLHFEQLTFLVNQEMLNNKRFLNLLEQLNQARSLEKLQLVFSEITTNPQELQNFQNAIKEALDKNIAPIVTYPIRVNSQYRSATFNNVLIKNIQNKYQNNLVQKKDDHHEIFNPNNLLGKKIKLKELISRNEAAHLEHYTPLQVQHIEVAQQTVVQEQTQAIETQTQIHAVNEYTGELLGYKEFSSETYKRLTVEAGQPMSDELDVERFYTLLQRELFANLPHAIKYVSPEAAEKLALNLPNFLTLNKENLPDGFIIQKTRAGELVLDYKPFLKNESSNDFTPTCHHFNETPLFHIDPLKLGIKEKLEDETLRDYIFPKNAAVNNRLNNLWIKYGEQGVIDFSKKFKNATASNLQLKSYLLEKYFGCFAEWDHFYTNPLLFTVLERLSHYDENKLTCLAKFLDLTGVVQHDLVKTVQAFETFWTELTFLCKEKDIAITEINASNWKAPVGNPVVFMERVLFILKNCRNLKEQMRLLDGVSLRNYGAYYAARYEGFKTVSRSMNLTFNPEIDNNKPFQKNTSLYHIELDELFDSFFKQKNYWEDICLQEDSSENSIYWLVDCSKPLTNPLNLDELLSTNSAIPFKNATFVSPFQLYKVEKNRHLKHVLTQPPVQQSNDDFYTACFRYIGQQSIGVSSTILQTEFEKFKTQFDLKGELLGMLFFTAHNRFDDPKSIGSLFRMLKVSSRHKHVLHSALKLLHHLHKIDIKFNPKEGQVLIASIAEMNSHEFQQHKLNKEECIEHLLKHLTQNKFAAIKLLNLVFEKFDRRWPLLYALDTADFLAQEPHVAAVYRDDLLVFGLLINSDREELYYQGISKKESENTKALLEKLGKVREYFRLAATQIKPNNYQYAIQILLNAETPFSYGEFLSCFDAIANLETFDSKKVEKILLNKKFPIKVAIPSFLLKDEIDFKNLMIPLAIELEKIKYPHSTGKSMDPQEAFQLRAQITSLPMEILQEKLSILFRDYGNLLSVAGGLLLTELLKTAKEIIIKNKFGLPNSKGLLKVVGEKIASLPGFETPNTFAKIDLITTQAQNIAYLLRDIENNSFVKEHLPEFIDLFSCLDFTKIEYETLYAVLSLLQVMPYKNYLPLLKTIFSDPHFISEKHLALELTILLSTLNRHCFPAQYLNRFSQLMIETSEKGQMNLVVEKLCEVFAKDSADPIVEFILTYPKLNYAQVKNILFLTADIKANRDKIFQFVNFLLEHQYLDVFIAELQKTSAEKQNMILEIISKSHSLKRAQDQALQTNQYLELAQSLLTLSDNELTHLRTFFTSTPVNVNCLHNAMVNKEKKFDQFLKEFEKAPFGKRLFSEQFSLTEVERVVNQSKDLVNNSIYPFQYRKQLTEAFLFVNSIGYELAIFGGKSVSELSNEDIRNYFAYLKNMDTTHSRLTALALMREAMYRSTGEFPYSTQMLSLIDGILHKGDYITNIDTGQGKSLTDVMKAVLLWLKSDRVEFITSSLVDAKRDIANYGSFLQFLGIPYSQNPINSFSTVQDFQKEGVNFSTASQLSLFMAKAKTAGIEFETPTTIASLVINESDHVLLDNRVVNRLAISKGVGIKAGEEWIYDGINEFVSRPEYIAHQKTTAGEDVQDLYTYLLTKGKSLNKSTQALNNFNAEQYITWLESALVVNYILKENIHYVIPEEFEKRTIHGNEVLTKVVKVLLKDGKISPDSTFGKGIQQLLYAKLNKKQGRTDFHIELETQTIISTTNKNLIDTYRARKGFIWGSSASVGSETEIEKQQQNYGFEFSKIEPHQQSRVRFNTPVVMRDEEAQFACLIKAFSTVKKDTTQTEEPNIVFCKDINTAKRLFGQLSEAGLGKPIQLYTGLGREEQFIHQATQPGMITITTSALGRNSDFKSAGLCVWHTYIDSKRGIRQKDGRTGRQGTEGEVNWVLNQQELNNKTIEEVQTELDLISTKEREANEALYNVLGFFFTFVDNLPQHKLLSKKSNFFQKQWAEFSTRMEACYSEALRADIYDEDTFLKSAVEKFQEMISPLLNANVTLPNVQDVQEFVRKKHPKTLPYTPDTRVVRLKDCVPSIAGCYKELGLSDLFLADTISKEEIKEKLKVMFADIQRGQFISANNEYLRYISQNAVTQNLIAEAHKEFLAEFLKENSYRMNFIKRWLGFSGPLSKIAGNTQYIIMFHAFAQNSHQVTVEFDTIKNSVVTLLDEYLDGWFINAERRAWVAELKHQVKDVNNLDELILCLGKEQGRVAQQDIKTNKNRWFKSLHWFGESRLQSILSEAINLSTALGGKTDITEAMKPISSIVSDTESATPFYDLTPEVVNSKIGTKIDRQNAVVLNKMIEKNAAVKHREEPVGMVGRGINFFKASDEENRTESEIAQQVVSAPLLISS